jgi:parallel beta-helix repeat protein
MASSGHVDRRRSRSARHRGRRTADLAGSTLLVTSDTTLRDDHRGSVEIEADDVTLDCAGHTISGPGTRAEDEYGFVGILLDGRSGTTVKNCRVSGFDYGILMTARLGSGSDGNRLVDNAAFGNHLDGVRVHESEHNVLTGNIASSNGQHGFAFLGNSNIVTGNQAFDNEYDGFVVDSRRRDIVFSANISKGNQNGFVIVGTGHTLLRNTAADNGDNGFAIGSGSRHIAFYRNTSTGNRNHGFGILGTGHTFARNRASENGLVGFTVGGLGSGDITFEGNRAIENRVYGFQVLESGGNTFIRNTAANNRAVGFSLELGAHENALYRNIARNNGEDGFRTMQDSTRNTFKGNVALDNRWSGFRAESGPNFFSKNRACKNGEADALDVGSNSTWRSNVFCLAVAREGSAGMAGTT